MSLKCRDIHGNMPGTKMLGNFHNRDRRQIRDVNKNDDIQGTIVGSLVKGIKMPEGHKLRHINNMNPEYQMPG